jgi:hypothetical protein
MQDVVDERKTKIPPLIQGANMSGKIQIQMLVHQV